jgi:hypothetical protein
MFTTAVGGTFAARACLLNASAVFRFDATARVTATSPM